MGTTVVLALSQGEQIHIAHVGDILAYLLTHGELRQLTEDHAMVAQLIIAGRLTPRRLGLMSDQCSSVHAFQKEKIS